MIGKVKMARLDNSTFMRTAMERLSVSFRPVFSRLAGETAEDTDNDPDAAARPAPPSEAERLHAAAAELILMRRRRDSVLPSRLLGEPAWDMLLAAFAAPSGAISRSRLANAVGRRTTATDRWIAVLEEERLLEPYAPVRDITQIEPCYRLTSVGREKMSEALRQMLRD